MPQVVWADRLTLPPDSTGKATGMVPVAVTGGTLYLPASVMVDATGNTIDSATAAPAGTERGLITRNIPSGTQPVSLAAIPTVTEKQDQTANVALRVPTTTTAGAVTIEVSQDGTDWVPAGAVRQDNSYAENPVPLAYFPGTNGTRVYALSIDAFTLIRVKLTTAIVGAGNVVVTISAVAGGIEPVVATRARKVASYSAFYRTATRPYKLGPSMTANTRKQVATIHHAATATKTVRIRRAMFCIYANTVAGEANIDLVRITTAPATGNPAITPGVLDSSDVAAEATCLALPTTAATEAALIGSQYVSLGATGAAATTNPPPIGQWMDLYQPAPDDDEMKQPTIRAGVLEGWAIVLDHTATSPVSMGAWIEFTEEAP
jgi:hypothetical protein